MKKLMPKLLFLFALSLGSLLFSGSANAYTNSRLIDNQVFDNVNAMSEAAIRNFINQRPGTCLVTSGAIFPEPIDYWTYGGNVDAARVIYKAAQYSGVNPQVIISTLQKEQSLITDTDCLDPQGVPTLPKAMGMGCFEGQPCPTEAYRGFEKQVMKGTWLLAFGRQRAEGNIGWGENNSATYSGPMTRGTYRRCGSCALIYFDGYATIDSQSVFMENGATATMYNYTPHLGQSFPGIFERWFGPTTPINGSILLSRGVTLSQSSVAVNDTITASYDIQNTANFDINAGGFGVCARLNGAYYDFGFIHHQIIPANGIITISFSKRIDALGSLVIFLCSYNENMGGWVSNIYPYDSSGTLVRQTAVNVSDNPLITAGIGLLPVNPSIGQPVTATLTVRNTSNNPINIGSMVIAGRDPAGRNVDFGIVNDVVVPANGMYTYSKTQTFTTPGSYTLFIAQWKGVWSTNYPKSVDTTVIRQTTVNVLDNPLMTVGIGLSPTNPVVGQPVTATMTMRNVSGSSINIGSMVIAGRDPAGRNVDFGIVNDVVVPANGMYTYSKTQTFTTPGSYTLFIAQWKGVWSTNYPKSVDTTVIRQMSLQVP